MAPELVLEALRSAEPTGLPVYTIELTGGDHVSVGVAWLTVNGTAGLVADAK
jgi:hypothetical protein